MPPRYSYWTILIDGGPTAFRAATRWELIPTLRQLQSKNPGADIKWFARGRVWESPEEAQRALEQQRRPRFPRHGGRSRRQAVASTGAKKKS
jgi:hypothetical protein